MEEREREIGRLGEGEEKGGREGERKSGRGRETKREERGEKRSET